MKKFPHQLTENVKLLQKVVIWHHDEFLIMLRSPDSPTRPNCWDLPGGNVEWPELGVDLKNPHVDDLAREVKEETGLIIDSSQSADRRNIRCCFVGSYFESQRQIYTIIIGWQYRLSVSTELPKVELSIEHQNFAWIKVEDFDKYNFGFAGEKGGFIREIVNNLK